jgi:hypothetical protein
MTCLGGAAVFLLLIAAPNATSARAAAPALADEPSPISEYISGDADCSGIVDPADVPEILRFAAGVERSPCSTATANVYCRDIVDAKDALAVLRHILGWDDALPSLCPPVGEKVVQAPEASLECDPPEAEAGQAVTCVFSAATYGDADLQFSLDYSAASSLSETYRALSVACPPHGLLCIWGASGEATLTFDRPGMKRLSLTACEYDSCREVQFSVMVSPGN